MEDLLDKYFSDELTTDDYAKSNNFYPPASFDTIQIVERSLERSLPKDYRSFLQTTNGYNGKLGKSYSVFLQIEKIEEYTRNYGGDTYPWIIFIGTDGGNEMYVIDTRQKEYRFGILPYIGEDNDFIDLGETFEGFVRHLYYNDYWPT